MSVIEVRNVSKSFGKQRVLRDVSFTCEAGRIYGLIGRNGSGKTVLMRCIIGLLRPDEGEILVSGKRIGRDAEFAGNIGFLIENPGFLAGESGFANLKYLASIRGAADKTRIRSCMELVGLDPTSRKRVGKYSLGMRQRLGIAQAIMERPEILMLDEPMNGLDNAGVKEMRQMLKRQRDEGRTVLLASHNREDIAVLCDRVFRIDAGVLEKETGETPENGGCSFCK